VKARGWGRAAPDRSYPKAPPAAFNLKFNSANVPLPATYRQPPLLFVELPLMVPSESDSMLEF
jgi:hypothetical protein